MNNSDRHLICTIIAPNYFSQALTLGASLSKYMPQVDFRILVLQDCLNTDYLKDGIASYQIPGNEGSHTSQCVIDVDWMDFDVWNAANNYDLLEFATSVKPALLRHFLNQGWGRVTYLDPDTQVHTDFESLLDDQAPMSLIPHIVRDFPYDGRKPDQNEILTSGIFNLGFISVRQEASTFLDWWSRKLEIYCTVDTERNLFVDQRWMDWSIAFSNPQIIRNPGINVAYWNLHERQVNHFAGDSDRATHYEVMQDELSVPLYFFHFSGFTGKHLSQLTKYSDRDFLTERVPEKLLKDYSAERSRWEKSVQVPTWSIAGRALGAALPKKHREMALSQARNARLTEHDLLQEDGSFVSVTNNVPLAPSPCPACSSCAQPLLRRSVENFATWLKANRISSHADLAVSGYDEASLNYFSRVFADRREQIAGLKLVGCFASPTGVGQSARNILETLDAGGVRVFAENIPTPVDASDLREKFAARSQPDIDHLPSALVVVNAENWLFEVVYSNRVNLQTQNVGAVWAWEIEDVPDYFRGPIKKTDVIFAVSPFSASALSSDLGTPITYLPTFGELKEPTLSTARDADFLQLKLKHGIEDQYLFARFDSKSVLKRKNPDAILDVWEQIHQEYPEFQLVIKTSNLQELASPQLMQRMRDFPRLVVLDEILPQAVNSELMSNASAYISLHRAEGLGLNILEAITFDIPTIYTNFSGISSEYDGIHFPVEYAMVKVGSGAGSYESESMWAEPDIADAIAQTRKALDGVLSGDWKLESKVRRTWLEEFYRKGHARTVELAKDLLDMPAKGITESAESGYLKAKQHIKKALVLFVRRLWRLFPLATRTKFRPFAMRTYRRLF